MKKLVILTCLSILATLAIAQTPFSLKKGESCLVYSLPKTEFIIELQTQKTTQKPGVFYRYSERYLATSKVITEEKSGYKLISIAVKPHAIPDNSRTYSVLPAKKSALNYISVDKSGILCGINVLCERELEATKSSTTIAETTANQQLLPLGEEYMMAGSEAKLAEGAAKQIYRIRESRLGLLTADLEKLPTDGASLKSMLEGLDAMEQSLTELFTGKTTTEIQTQILKLTPDVPLNKQVLFRLSALRGVVANDDLSGAPCTISLNTIQSTDLKANIANKPTKVGIYTIFPSKAELSIEFGNKILFSEEYQLPQFGKLIPLNETMFSNPKLKVKVDRETGRLLNFE